MYSQKYTYAECRDTVLGMLERYSSNGKLNTCGEAADIELRLRRSINIHLRKLYAEFPVSIGRQRVEFSAPAASFDYGSFGVSSEEIFTKYFGGEGLAFYIEASGTGDIIFFTTEQTKAYGVDTSHGEVEVLRDVIVNEPGADAHFLVCGAPEIRIHTFKIFEGFDGGAEDSELICGDGRCSARVPRDMGKLIGIYDAHGKRIRENDIGFEISGGIMYADSGFGGLYTLEYEVLPSGFEKDCEDSAAIELSPILFDALCYMSAADLCPASDGEVYSKLTYKYREILENYYDRTKNVRRGRNVFYGAIARDRGDIDVAR